MILLLRTHIQTSVCSVVALVVVSLLGYRPPAASDCDAAESVLMHSWLTGSKTIIMQELEKSLAEEQEYRRKIHPYRLLHVTVI